jgi:SAM-dependent methyltransferase
MGRRQEPREPRRAIGPRSEIEIFGLWSAGFSRDRIKGLDLFSYSPFIDVGDMHAMPYPDNSFDVVILSEVLPYSKDQSAAVREVLRLCRNKAVVAVATSTPGENNGRATFKGEATDNQDTSQILGLFDGHVKTVYFRHEAAPPEIMLVMAVFEIAKSQ